MGYWIRLGWVDQEKEEEESEYAEGDNPSILQRISFPLSKENSSLPAYGEWFVAVSLLLCLADVNLLIVCW